VGDDRANRCVSRFDGKSEPSDRARDFFAGEKIQRQIIVELGETALVASQQGRRVFRKIVREVPC
jgi:hypothetical protein